jgi:hypothetical protein
VRGRLAAALLCCSAVAAVHAAEIEAIAPVANPVRFSGPTPPGVFVTVRIRRSNPLDTGGCTAWVDTGDRQPFVRVVFPPWPQRQSDEQRVPLTYPAPGTFQIRASGADGCGGFATTQVTVEHVDAAAAAIAAPTPAPAPVQAPGPGAPPAATAAPPAPPGPPPGTADGAWAALAKNEQQQCAQGPQIEKVFGEAYPGAVIRVHGRCLGYIKHAALWLQTVDGGRLSDRTDGTIVRHDAVTVFFTVPEFPGWQTGQLDIVLLNGGIYDAHTQGAVMPYSATPPSGPLAMGQVHPAPPPSPAKSQALRDAVRRDPGVAARVLAATPPTPPPPLLRGADLPANLAQIPDHVPLNVNGRAVPAGDVKRMVLSTPDGAALVLGGVPHQAGLVKRMLQPGAAVSLNPQPLPPAVAAPAPPPAPASAPAPAGSARNAAFRNALRTPPGGTPPPQPAPASPPQ